MFENIFDRITSTLSSFFQNSGDITTNTETSDNEAKEPPTSSEKAYLDLKSKYNSSDLVSYLQKDMNAYRLITKDFFTGQSLYQYINCTQITHGSSNSLSPTLYSNLTSIGSIKKFLNVSQSYQIHCMSFKRDTSHDDVLLLESLKNKKNYIANYLLNTTSGSSLTDKTCNGALSYAIKNKNIFAITTILNNHMDISESSIRKSLSLLSKSNTFNNKIMKMLINSSALKQALFESLKDGNVSFTNYLLNFGVETNYIDGDGKGPLYYSINKDNEHAFKKILKLQMGSAFTPIKKALALIANSSHYKVNNIETILDSDINFSDFKNQLFAITRTAVRNGDLDIVKKIIDKKLFITEELNKLIVIASGNQKDNSPLIVEYLLNAGGKCEKELGIAIASGNNKTQEAIKEICNKPEHKVESNTEWLESLTSSLNENYAFFKTKAKAFICNNTELTVYATTFSTLLATQKEGTLYLCGKPPGGTMKSWGVNFINAFLKFFIIIPVTKMFQNCVTTHICNDKNLDEEIEALKSYKEAKDFLKNHKDKAYYLSCDNCPGNDIIKNGPFEHHEVDWVLCQRSLIGTHNDGV
jgi:hypothetical protein